MKQTGNISGALWCDEGVYHIAWEIQLLSPSSFDNVFVGLGGFHIMEGVVMACFAKYLKGTGIDKFLINTEIYRSISVETVLIELTFLCLTARYIFQWDWQNKYDQFIEGVMCLQNLFQDRQINHSEIEMKWNECQLQLCKER